MQIDKLLEDHLLEPERQKESKINAQRTQRLIIFTLNPTVTTQCAEQILDKITKAIKETFEGLKLKLQGF